MNVPKKNKRLGFEFVHVPAIRPVAMVNYDGSGMRRYWGCDMSLGELGCFLAHREAWKMISNNESGPVLIVEDDVGFNPGAAHAIAGVLASMPLPDFVSLYSDWSRTCVRQTSVANNYKIGIPLSSGNTTVAYAVGPAGAGFLLEGPKVIKCTVDGYLLRGWLHGVRGLHCLPFPCIHDDGGKSLIGKRVAPPAVGLNLAMRKLSQLTHSIFKRIYRMRSLIGPARR